MTEKERAQARGAAEGEGEAGSPPGREPDSQGSIPEPGDHDLSQRQMLKQLGHPGAPKNVLLQRLHVCRSL